MAGTLARPRTAAAAERNRELGAERAARDPRKCRRAVRTVATALVEGTTTVAEILAHAEAYAASAPAPNRQTIESIRALLGTGRAD